MTENGLLYFEERDVRITQVNKVNENEYWVRICKDDQGWVRMNKDEYWVRISRDEYWVRMSKDE